eukprot:scaffold1430_cov257-Pinguiococcus_pyrenoidosus.AAC.1
MEKELAPQSRTRRSTPTGTSPSCERGEDCTSGRNDGVKGLHSLSTPDPSRLLIWPERAEKAAPRRPQSRGGDGVHLCLTAQPGVGEGVGVRATDGRRAVAVGAAGKRRQGREVVEALEVVSPASDGRELQLRLLVSRHRLRFDLRVRRGEGLRLHLLARHHSRLPGRHAGQRHLGPSPHHMRQRVMGQWSARRPAHRGGRHFHSRGSGKGVGHFPPPRLLRTRRRHGRHGHQGVQRRAGHVVGRGLGRVLVAGQGGRPLLPGRSRGLATGAGRWALEVGDGTGAVERPRGVVVDQRGGLLVCVRAQRCLRPFLGGASASGAGGASVDGPFSLSFVLPSASFLSLSVSRSSGHGGGGSAGFRRRSGPSRAGNSLLTVPTCCSLWSAAGCDIGARAVSTAPPRAASQSRSAPVAEAGKGLSRRGSRGSGRACWGQNDGEKFGEALETKAVAVPKIMATANELRRRVQNKPESAFGQLRELAR